MLGSGLSKVRPRIVYSASSAYSGTINVWDDRGSLILEVGGYYQSASLNTPDLPKRYWSRAAREIEKRLKNPKRGLVIGVGGATILHLLAQKFPGLKLVGIEIDEEIVKVARRFFDLDEIPNLSVVVGDGVEYVRSYEGEKFDFAFIDAYLGGRFPPHFAEKRFLQRLRAVTAPEGVVVVNRTTGPGRLQFERLLDSAFAKVEMIKVPLPGFLGELGGNFLFFCR